MATNINVDDAPYQEKLITINGESLYLTVMYNTSDDFNNTDEGSWYFDLADRNKESVISSVKVIPFQNLTGRYLHLNTLLGGALWCVNVKDEFSDITRSNFGTSKKFQLWYISDDETLELGLEG